LIVSDSLKNVFESVLNYETIINSADEQSNFFFFVAVWTAHSKSFCVTKSGKRITEIQ
jgi:hypothetical protein